MMLPAKPMSTDANPPSNNQNRRTFLATAASALIVPRHVLGKGYVPPSDQITLAHIGTGTEGLREMTNLLPSPQIRIVAVCDPNKHAVGYRDWSPNGLRNDIRELLGNPNWSAGEGQVPGGLDAGKDMVDSYYAAKRPNEHLSGCAAYADFRELLDKEKDLDAVKIMTPDHLHGVVSIAAMRKRKHVIMHKPLSNRLLEGKLVIETARSSGVATYFMPWDSNGSMKQVMAWIDGGEIGALREVHNWTNRPVWPQYPTIPTDAPPVPEGLNWDLWLGPEADRPYQPEYTHMVFRGWYDFGGGSMADMGHYSLWTVFNALELAGPTSIEPMLSHHCIFKGNAASGVKNDFSFPEASCVRFRYPATSRRAAIELIWWDGGMRPPTPPELEEDHQELPIEGMMFVGDKGKILAGFRVENPRLIPAQRMAGQPAAEPPMREPKVGEAGRWIPEWVSACKGGKPSPGNFLNAGPITEAVNLYAVALRTRRRLRYDAANTKITNDADANRYLARAYRKGWDPNAG